MFPVKEIFCNWHSFTCVLCILLGDMNVQQFGGTVEALGCVIEGGSYGAASQATGFWKVHQAVEGLLRCGRSSGLFRRLASHSARGSALQVAGFVMNESRRWTTPHAKEVRTAPAESTGGGCGDGPGESCLQPTPSRPSMLRKDEAPFD